MSVLLDALKKSEEEKRKAEGQEPDAEVSALKSGAEEKAEQVAQPQEAETSKGEAEEKSPVASAPQTEAKPSTTPAEAKPSASGGGGIGKLGMFSQSAPVAKPKPRVTKRPTGAGGKPVGAQLSVGGGDAVPGGSPADSGMNIAAAPKPAPAPTAQVSATSEMSAAPSTPRPTTFDFDSIEEEPSEGSKSAQSVAGSVVDAGESAVDTTADAYKGAASGRGPLLAIAAGGVLAVAGGAYFLLSPAPSVTTPPQPQPSSTVAQSQQEQAAPEDLLPLPNPNVDIQSELVNFASYTNTDSVTEEEIQNVADRIAVLTSGFLESAVESPSAPTQEEEGGVGIAISDAPIEAEVESLVEIDPATYPLSDASESAIELFNRHSDVALGDGVKLYAVASGVDVDANSDEALAQAAEAEDAEASITVASDIVISSSEKSGVIERLLSEAKREYESGDLGAAEVVFRKILSDEANNVNAMKGLAMVASETGRYRLAASIYLKVLDLKPDDPIAISELISLHTRQPNYRLTEEKLKSLLGRVPAHDGRLYFSLGNLYAEQGRWHEAQSNYFNALSQDSDNPDYAFNLAVSLEYINRQHIALNYYKIAQELAASNSHSFEESVLTTRILQLDN